MAALHQHAQPLETLRIDAVDGHCVLLQSSLVPEVVVAEGAAHAPATLNALVLVLVGLGGGGRVGVRVHLLEVVRGRVDLGVVKLFLLV